MSSIIRINALSNEIATHIYFNFTESERKAILENNDKSEKIINNKIAKIREFLKQWVENGCPENFGK